MTKNEIIQNFYQLNSFVRKVIDSESNSYDYFCGENNHTDHRDDGHAFDFIKRSTIEILSQIYPEITLDFYERNKNKMVIDKFD